MSSPAVVFCGPTLGRADAQALLPGAHVAGPVSQGDVLMAARSKPSAIGIVDGYFEAVPSVWHKEILDAMQRGIPVFGAASMGALRAAELHRFGMRGIGAIFEAFRDVRLTDDDEVAVIHGPADSGFRPLSEAMVNIRATLASAARQGPVSSRTASVLTGVAKSLFYPDRTYANVIAGGRAAGLDGDELDALVAWLPGGAVDQKRQDAVSMLEAMSNHLKVDDQGEAGRRTSVEYRMERTVYWQDLVVSCAAGSLRPEDEELQGELLAELALRPDLFERVRERALAREAAAELQADPATTVADQASLSDAMVDICATFGLETEEDLDDWLDHNHLARDEFAALVRDHLAVRVAAAGRRTLAASMIDELKLMGKFGDLLDRARTKKRRLCSVGLDTPRAVDAGLDIDEIVRRHFDGQGRPVPQDLVRHAESLGLKHVAVFEETLLREWVYRSRWPDPVGPDDSRQSPPLA